MTEETAAETPSTIPHGLHTPDTQGKRHYCGPTAIAAITGASFETIYKKIRRVRSDMEFERWGRRNLIGGRVLGHSGRKLPIKGMYNPELIETMKRFGFKVKAKGKGTRSNPKGHATQMTLREFLEDRGHCGLMIVNVTNHYVTVSRGMILDTRTGSKPVPMMTYAKLKRRVENWWQFTT